MNRHYLPWIVAGSHGIALGVALVLLVLLFVPLSYERWLELRTLDELVYPDAIIFSLVASCSSLGVAYANGPAISPRWRSRGLELLLAVSLLAVSFLGIFALPPLYRWGRWQEFIFLGLGGIFFALSGWLVALGSWAFAGVVRWKLSHCLGDGSVRTGVVVLLLALAGKLQPKQEMMVPLAGLASTMPVSWGLECITLFMDGPLLGTYHKNRCEKNPVLCLPLHRRASLSGGLCTSASEPGLRSSFPDARAVLADSILKERLNVPEESGEDARRYIEGILDELEPQVSPCSVEVIESRVMNSWAAFVSRYPSLVFYRRHHLGPAFLGLFLSTLGWVGILMILTRLSNQTTMHNKQETAT